MCRYGEYGPYKEHYACFDCRKMFRSFRPIPCPECGLSMKEMAEIFLLQRKGIWNIGK